MPNLGLGTWRMGGNDATRGDAIRGPAPGLPPAVSLIRPGRTDVAGNQVLYNVQRRGIERKLLPGCAERAIAIMAYSPFDQGRLKPNRMLQAVAARHGMSPAQVALAWVLRHERVVAIPKA